MSATPKILVLFCLSLVSLGAGAQGLLTGEFRLAWEDGPSPLVYSPLASDLAQMGPQTDYQINEEWAFSSIGSSSFGYLYGSDADTSVSVDITRKLLGADDNYLSLGLGWDQTNASYGMVSSGAQLLLRGRMGLADLGYLYGQTSWFMELEDISGRSGLSGYELEAGFSLMPAPYWSVRAGYRLFRFDYDGDTAGATSTTGVLLGSGLHW